MCRTTLRTATVHEFETKASRRSLSNAKSLRSEVGLLAADKIFPIW